MNSLSSHKVFKDYKTFWLGLSKPCGLKTSHLIGANCLRNKRWLVVALPDVRSKVNFPTWLASSQKSTFNNYLSFTWSKKYTNEVVPTLTTQYIWHVQSARTIVNQVFQNCHVCIFCKCLSLHQSLGQKERKHSGWSALLVRAVAKRGSLLTISSTEVPEHVHSGVIVVHLTIHSKTIISTAGALVYWLDYSHNSLRVSLIHSGIHSRIYAKNH